MILAKVIGRPLQAINEIIKGKKSVSPLTPPRQSPRLSVLVLSCGLTCKRIMTCTLHPMLIQRLK